MTGKSKGGEQSPPAGIPLTPENLQGAMRELEPGWSVPTLDQLKTLIAEIELIDGFVKQRDPRTPKRRINKPVRAALKLLREAAESQTQAINSGALEFLLLVQAAGGEFGHIHDELRTKQTLEKLAGFVAWMGDDSDERVAAMFGEEPSPPIYQSWHGKCRLWAPKLAAIWRPEGGQHTLSNRSSIVKLLHGLLIATGESDEPGKCTRDAVYQFLLRNRELLQAP